MCYLKAIRVNTNALNLMLESSGAPRVSQELTSARLVSFVGRRGFDSLILPVGRMIALLLLTRQNSALRLRVWSRLAP